MFFIKQVLIPSLLTCGFILFCFITVQHFFDWSFFWNLIILLILGISFVKVSKQVSKNF